RRYLRTLRTGLDTIGAKAPLLIMQSNGGLMTDEAAAAKPVHVIESGPAAGVVGAQALARKIDLGRLVTFDMGGTTAKASIVEDGEVSRATEYQVGGGIMHGSRLLTGAGYPRRAAALDFAEVGVRGHAPQVAGDGEEPGSRQHRQNTRPERRHLALTLAGLCF